MKPIIVAGPGRSGTTWVGELIARLVPVRLVFEPLHPKKVATARGLAYRYVRPDGTHPRLLRFWGAALTDRVPGRWVHHLDDGVRHASHLIVKEIHANLALGWLAARFPHVPIVFCVRHPCAVVASRLRRRWPAALALRAVLDQPMLRRDHLADVTRVLQGLRTEAEQHAALWAIDTRVALRHAERHPITVVRYEALVEEGNPAVARLAAAVGVPFRPLSDEELGRPSRVAEWNDGRTAAMAPEAWRSELSGAEVDRILGIADAFGLSAAIGEEVPA